MSDLSFENDESVPVGNENIELLRKWKSPLVCSLASKQTFFPENQKLTFKKYPVTRELIDKERIDDSRYLKRLQ